MLWYWQITDAWGQICPQVPPDATCVHGHFQADQLSANFPEAHLITWVRDPVERVVSSYYHRLREPDWQHPVCQKLHREQLSLVDFASLAEMRNEMCHFVGQKRPKDFTFIGVVEDFERSFAGMRAILGMQEFAIRRDNTNPARVDDRYRLDPGVRRAIGELNADDVALYAECLRHAARPLRPLAADRRGVPPAVG